MKTHPHKSKGVRHVTLLDVKQNVKVGYTRAMVKSWIMLGSTGKVHFATYQFVWFLATQIVQGSHLDIKDYI